LNFVLKLELTQNYVFKMNYLNYAIQSFVVMTKLSLYYLANPF